METIKTKGVISALVVALTLSCSTPLLAHGGWGYGGWHHRGWGTGAWVGTGLLGAGLLGAGLYASPYYGYNYNYVNYNCPTVRYCNAYGGCWLQQSCY